MRSVNANRIGWRAACCATVMLLALCWRADGAVAQPPPKQAQADHHDERGRPPPPLAPGDRKYESDRRRSLSARERFDNTSIPPGYTPQTWYQELAASDAYDRGYQQGFQDGLEAAARQSGANRNESFVENLMATGDEHFRHRRYGEASRSFLLAAKQNQGDPASRLRGAHAAVALRRYDQAYLLIRRAFQLQPKIPYLPIDLRRDFDDPAELVRHMNQLEKAARDAGDDSALWTLVGYYRFFTGRYGDAVGVLERAVSLDRRNRVAVELLAVAHASSPPQPADR